jgi:hypothetical protein
MEQDEGEDERVLVETDHRGITLADQSEQPLLTRRGTP